MKNYRCTCLNSLISYKVFCISGTVILLTPFHVFTVKPHIGYADKLKKPQSLKGGQKLVLDTNIEGLPVPTVTWTFNGEALESNGHTFVETNSTYSRVSLVDAVVTQSGVYKIVAENSVGKDEAEFNVAVKGELYLIQFSYIYRIHSHISRVLTPYSKLKSRGSAPYSKLKSRGSAYLWVIEV